MSTIGKLYVSNVVNQTTLPFQTIPFHSASIDWKREEASTMSFKSPKKLENSTRVRYVSGTTSFGGQIYKQSHTSDGEYSYDVISYLRLYHDKVNVTMRGKTSAQIMRYVLKLSGNNFRTSGVKDTVLLHNTLTWDNTSIWDIACQLCWLEHQAGYECRCYIDADGTLIFGYTSKTESGYTFTNALDYSEDYDSSDFITYSAVTYNDKTIASATSNASLLAKWGYVGEFTECSSSTKTTTTKKTTTTSSSTSSLKDSSAISKYNIASSVWKQALKIVKKGNTNYQNLKLLYKWCDVKIKYQGYPNTRYGAKGTLSRRKGNCCDNANLLIAMARSVGIKARYAHAHRNGKGHVWGEYYVNGKWFTCDTGVTSTGRYWGSHCNYAGSVTNRYNTLPF